MSTQATAICSYSNQTILISLHGIQKASFSVRASFDRYEAGNLLTFSGEIIEQVLSDVTLSSMFLYYVIFVGGRGCLKF